MDESEYAPIIYLIMASLFEASLGKQGSSTYDLYADLEFKFVKERRSLLWPEFKESYPVTSNLSRMSKTLSELETRLSDPIGKTDDWRLLIKGMHDPFVPESFGLQSHQRAAKVGHRLGRMVRKIGRSPETLGKLLQGSRERPFTDSGVVLHFRTPGGMWGRRGYV